MSEYICDLENELCTLEVYECGCGYHIGLDFTYMNQVTRKYSVICPNCEEQITPDQDEEERKSRNGDCVECGKEIADDQVFNIGKDGKFRHLECCQDI